MPYFHVNTAYGATVVHVALTDIETLSVCGCTVANPQILHLHKGFDDFSSITTTQTLLLAFFLHEKPYRRV
jgi:hypothetical protein